MPFFFFFFSFFFANNLANLVDDRRIASDDVVELEEALEGVFVVFLVFGRGSQDFVGESEVEERFYAGRLGPDRLAKEFTRFLVLA